MIAVSTQKQALETAEFVLDHSQVSDAARARFAALLVEKAGGGLVAKRLMLMDVINFYGTAEAISMLKHPYVGRHEDSWSMRIEGLASGLLYFTTLNPQATSNRIHDSFATLAALAEKRDLKGMTKFSDNLSDEQLGGFQVKNLAGRLLLQMTMPAFDKVAKSYWEVDDRRVALMKRLREMPSAK